jgi:hypothetical protein
MLEKNDKDNEPKFKGIKLTSSEQHLFYNFSSKQYAYEFLHYI